MSALPSDVIVTATECIGSFARPLLITHTKPDGDALGSLVAMRSILAAQGKRARALLFDPLPGRYGLFSRYGPLSVLGADVGESDLSEADGIIILDTCAYAQLDPIERWLRGARQKKLVVDHHATREPIADVYVVDESAAANCLILFEWARQAEWQLDKHAREALFIGIAMDTGWFRHSNADPRALSAAAELMADGVDAHALYQQLYQNETAGRVRLLGAALESMELLEDGKVAIMVIPAGTFARMSAEPADTEEIVSEPLRIGSVVMSVLLVESGDGIVRLSFRSKAPVAKGAPDVDVAALAQSFGGGGHRRAAGARVKSTIVQVRDTVAFRAHVFLTEPGSAGSRAGS